jgi:hypothetical protein
VLLVSDTVWDMHTPESIMIYAWRGPARLLRAAPAAAPLLELDGLVWRQHRHAHSAQVSAHARNRFRLTLLREGSPGSWRDDPKPRQVWVVTPERRVGSHRVPTGRLAPRRPCILLT